MAGATTFFFLAFLFAYFYLRSVNESHMFKPAHVKPEQGYGWVIVGVHRVERDRGGRSGRQMRAHGRSWVSYAAAAVGLGLAAVVAQCLEYTAQHFGPTDGGYASVFCGWTGLYAVAVLATMYWLETQVATELRARRAPAASDGDIADADKLIAPGLDAAVFFWCFLAAIGVITWVTLYLL